MRQTLIQFRSGSLTLEGVFTLPQLASPHVAAVVVCHPHPLFGGNMDNPVVKSICMALDGEAIAALRFNFRGVGNSQGTFTNGLGEKEDLESVLKVAKNLPGIDGKRIGLTGYSFGASVILDGLPKCKVAKALALISPPLSAVRRSSIYKDKRPKLFLVGERDRLVPPPQLREAVSAIQSPVELQVIPGADHGLAGHDSTVAIRVAEFFTKVLR